VVAIVFQSVFVPKCIKIMFFYFLKLFLRSAHQTGPKHKKKYFLAKNNLNF
jgi:hypothetical protein